MKTILLALLWIYPAHNLAGARRSLPIRAHLLRLRRGGNPDARRPPRQLAGNRPASSLPTVRRGGIDPVPRPGPPRQAE